MTLLETLYDENQENVDLDELLLSEETKSKGDSGKAGDNEEKLVR